MRKTRHPTVRICLFSLGVLLMIATPFVGAIPGPGGVFVFAGGLALTLQNSRWAKRRFVHTKRRWPRVGHYADMGLRRASARRRRERARSERETAYSTEANGLPAPAGATDARSSASSVLRAIQFWRPRAQGDETRKR